MHIDYVKIPFNNNPSMQKYSGPLIEENPRKKYLDEKQIEKKIYDGLDIIGRKDSFKRIELSDKFPKFILENKKNLKNWIID